MGVAREPRGTFRAVGFREILGGGITEAVSDFTELVLDEARDKALARIEAAASEQGADAIVALRMAIVSYVTGGAQALVYGTAVTLAGQERSAELRRPCG